MKRPPLPEPSRDESLRSQSAKTSYHSYYAPNPAPAPAAAMAAPSTEKTTTKSYDHYDSGKRLVQDGNKAASSGVSGDYYDDGLGADDDEYDNQKKPSKVSPRSRISKIPSMPKIGTSISANPTVPSTNKAKSNPKQGSAQNAAYIPSKSIVGKRVDTDDDDEDGFWSDDSLTAAQTPALPPDSAPQQRPQKQLQRQEKNINGGHKSQLRPTKQPVLEGKRVTAHGNATSSQPPPPQQQRRNEQKEPHKGGELNTHSVGGYAISLNSDCLDSHCAVSFFIGTVSLAPTAPVAEAPTKPSKPINPSMIKVSIYFPLFMRLAVCM